MTIAPPPLRVAMATYGDLAFDSRVQREALALAAAGHRVRLLCVEPGGVLPGSLTAAVDVVARYPTGLPADATVSGGDGRGGILRRILGRATWLLRYRGAASRWGRWAVAQAGDVDVWHVHDFPALAAIVPRLGRSAIVVYDSHEIFFEAGTAARLPGPLRWVLRLQERRLARRAVALVTVNDGVAAVLRSLRIPRTVVVHNYPPSTPDIADDGRLRRAAGIVDGAPVVLSHGSLSADRGLEQLVDATATPRLSGTHLVLLGFGTLGPELLDRARALGVGDRVHVLPAVDPGELPAWVVGADVSAMPIQPSTANHRLSTPNKLFESLAVGVPVVASDFPEMRRIVIDAPEGPLGATCDPTDVASIAGAIADLLALPAAERAALRARCGAAATTRMSWPAAASRLTGLYEDLERIARSRRPTGASTHHDPS